MRHHDLERADRVHERHPRIVERRVAKDPVVERDHQQRRHATQPLDRRDVPDRGLHALLGMTVLQRTGAHRADDSGLRTGPSRGSR